MKISLLRACALGATLAYAGTAFADDLVISADPVPAPTVTIIQETPAPTEPAQQHVTVVKEPVAEMRVEHEAVTDIDGDDVTSIIVKTQPPAPKEEVVRIESRPSEDYTWVPGYWQWDTARNEYEWVPGTWRRSIPDMTWHPGHWEQTDAGWRWIGGYWAPATTTRLTMVAEAPPAPRAEERPVSPGADYIWISGHWDYENGQYVWHSGRWERPTQEGMVWVPGRWVQTGEGYTYIAGRWDYPVENRAYVVTRVEGAPGTTGEHFDNQEDRVLPQPGPERDDN